MEWISVKEKLPGICEEVMFCFAMLDGKGTIYKKDIVCGHRDHAGWNVCYTYVSMPLTTDEKILKVTHWMPLPYPPETPK